MKLPILLLSLTFLAFQTFAQTPAPTPASPPADPKADTLVDCGKEKVVIFGNTATKDGAVALGWTIHRHRAKQPVDWKAYQSNDPNTFIARYPTRDDLSPGDYALINGVIDLRAKRFTPLATFQPYYPNKPDVTLHVAWSDDQRGTRFALVGNDGTTRTFNLWLVETSTRRVHAEDLAPTADRGVNNFLHKLGVKNTGDYRVSFSPVASPPIAPFKGNGLEIPFQAQVPKSDGSMRYSGTLTASLARGKITGVHGEKVAP